MEDKIEMLLTSYSLEEILEDNDITPEAVLVILINRGTLDISRYFEQEEEDDF